MYDTARFVLQKYAARATAKEGKAAAALLERLAAFARGSDGSPLILSRREDERLAQIRIARDMGFGDSSFDS